MILKDGVDAYIDKEVGIVRKYLNFLATLALIFLGLLPIIVDKNWWSGVELHMAREVVVSAPSHKGELVWI